MLQIHPLDYLMSQYIIPQQAREGLHKELKLLGLTQFSLFPELASVGAILREMMK